jgi:hypothetical protein
MIGWAKLRLPQSNIEAGVLTYLLVTAAIAAHNFPALYSKERNKRERGHTVKPPPAEDTGCGQSNHEDHRQIPAGDGFHRVSA